MSWFSRAAALGFAVLGSIVLPACSSWERVADDFPGKVGKGLNHERWTRDARIYGEFETVALVSMTLISSTMQTRLQDLVDDKTPGRQPSDIVGFSTAASEAAVVVILSSHAHDWRRLDRPRSPWAIQLDVGGGPLPAKSITKLNPTAAFEWYFPAWNPWSRAWLVTFPADADQLESAATVHLSAAGIKKTSLSWP